MCAVQSINYELIVSVLIPIRINIVGRALGGVSEKNSFVTSCLHSGLVMG